MNKYDSPSGKTTYNGDRGICVSKPVRVRIAAVTKKGEKGTLNLRVRKKANSKNIAASASASKRSLTRDKVSVAVPNGRGEGTSQISKLILLSKKFNNGEPLEAATPKRCSP